MPHQKKNGHFHQQVSDRLGLLPNFFTSAPAAPGLIEELWAFAQSAYLDNPLPSLFKERLFVYLSRFCPVRYCIVRHAGFLMGLGRPAGDARALPQTVEQVMGLLSWPLPDPDALNQGLTRLETGSPKAMMPDVDSPAEKDLVEALAVIFLEPRLAKRARHAVNQAYGERSFELLMAFLAFIRTAHYWTETHPELAYEPDMVALMDDYPTLAKRLLDPSEAEQVGQAEALRKTLASLQEVQAVQRQSEEKYRTLFDSMDEGFHISELVYNRAGSVIDWRFLDVNQAFERQTGLHNAMGQLGSEIAPNTEPHWLLTYDQVVQTGKPVHLENYNAFTGRWYSLYASRVGEAGSRQFAVVFNDITDRKRHEANLVFLADTVQDFAPVSSAEDIMQHVAQRLGDHLQLSRCNFALVDPEADRIEVIYDWRADQTMPGLLGVHRISDNLTEAGRQQYSAGRLSVVNSVQNNPLMAIPPKVLTALDLGSVIDVPYLQNGRWTFLLTVGRSQAGDWRADEIELVHELAARICIRIERAHAEEALRDSETRFRMLVQNLPDYAIFRIDPAGMITEWTEGAQHVKGYTAQEVMGQHIALFYTPEGLDAGELTLEMKQAAQSGRAERESVRIRKGGERFWVNEIMTAIRDGAGRLIGFTKISRDITRAKQAQEALQQADQRKDEFLAMLAHELRNPMSTIRSGLQILSLSAGDEETTHATVAMINRQTDHLVRLVDDLLDVSRISRGKIELRKGRVNIVELVRQTAQAIDPLYKPQGRHLSVTLPASPIYVEGDATRLAQVVTNLLTNGLRYTRPGGQVWLSLTHLASEAILEVRDNGIGLGKDQLLAIFELFVQVDNSLARAQGGLGLGLTLVRRLVELHGGRVDVQSDGLGKGSLFTIHLPTLTKATEFPSTSGESPTRQAARPQLLVIDDNPDAAMTLSMLLKLKGYDVHTRNSGQAGIEAAESLAPRVILLDIGMPDMDGYETCRAIRQRSWGQAVIVIALTGYGQDEDRQRTQAAGFDGHLVKPVDLAVLLKLVTELLDQGDINSALDKVTT